MLLTKGNNKYVVVVVVFPCYNSEISDYIPTSSLSPHFVILRPDNDVQKDADDIQLPLFTSLPKDDSKSLMFVFA